LTGVLAGRKIPLYVRPFTDPGSPGTEVSERVTAAQLPVKALSAATHQALVTVAGNGMLGVPGIAARTFAALQQRRISVSLISQASSEHSICFSVPDAAARDARAALLHEFREEIERREIDGWRSATGNHRGRGRLGSPGRRAWRPVFSALSAGGINVTPSPGARASSISRWWWTVIGRRRAAQIHAAFQLSIGGGTVTRPEQVEIVQPASAISGACSPG
jgi:aspartokinase